MVAIHTMCGIGIGASILGFLGAWIAGSVGLVIGAIVGAALGGFCGALNGIASNTPFARALRREHQRENRR